MSTNRLEETVQALLAPAKGILAADKTVGLSADDSNHSFTGERARVPGRRYPPELSEF
jgi:hypothetical protein